MAIAVLALVNALVATYLHLWKTGKAGSLACGAGGGCQLAQFSQYGTFLGVDVALIGAVGYGILLACALIALQPANLNARWTAWAAFVPILPAVLFTWRLKWGEWVVLKTFCPWCFISFVSIHACLVLAILEWRRLTRTPSPPDREPARMPLAA